MYHQGKALKHTIHRFCIGFTICLIILLACIIEAWGHDTPKIQDGRDTHTLSQQWPDGGEDLHWHEDADGRGAGAWDQCVADAYNPETDSYNLPGGRCAEESTPPPPVRQPAPPPPSEPDPPTIRSQSTTPSATTTTTIEESLGNVQETIPEDVEVPEPEMPMTEPEMCVEEYVERTFWKNYTLYTPTVLPSGVETLADLWEQYWWVGATEGAFYVYIDGCFLIYRGEGDIGTIPLTPNMGILVNQGRNGTLAGLRGCPVASQPQIELRQGWNLIGFPTAPETFERPSDLLNGSIASVIVSVEGELKLITRADDPGDEPFVNGQGLMVKAMQPTTINLDIASAPSIRRSVGNMTTTWGAMKAR